MPSRAPRSAPSRSAEARPAGRPVLAGLVSGTAALALYAFTIHADAWYGDVAEYHTLAATGGIAHAGYPAFVMLLQVFGRLPFSTYALRANLVSCLAAALAVGLAGYAAARLARSAALGVAPALALAASLTLWYNATHASVHAFTLPIGAALFLLAVRFSRGPRTGLAFGIGVLAGLGLLSHLSILGLIPVAVAALWRTGRERTLRLVHVVAATCGLLLGLLPLGYMVAQDRPDQPMNYIQYTLELSPGEHEPDAATISGRLERARWLLSGRQYLVREGYRPSQDVPRRLSFLSLDTAMNEFPLLGLPLAALGLWALARRRSWIAWLLSLWIAAVLVLLAYAAYPNIVRSFFLPGLWALSLLMAAGLDFLRAHRRRAATIAAVLLVVAPFARLAVPGLPGRVAPAGSLVQDVWSQWPRAWNPWTLDLSWEAFGHATMNALPPRAVVLSGWYEGMTLRYFRYAQVLRRDVDVIGTGPDRALVEGVAARAIREDRPVFVTFPPAAAGLDSIARPADPRLRGMLWRLAAPRDAGPLPAARSRP